MFNCFHVEKKYGSIDKYGALVILLPLSTIIIKQKIEIGALHCGKCALHCGTFSSVTQP
jgi:hypothetical protein